MASDIPVVFATCDSQSLEQIKQHLAAQPCERQRKLARFWHVDLEIPHVHPLDAKTLGAILVFRYLHRHLLSGIKAAVETDGLVLFKEGGNLTAEYPRILAAALVFSV